MTNESAISMLAALAQDHRLRIFRLVVQRGPNGLPAGEIADGIGLSATGTSFHLKELVRAGLLRATRDGRFIRYAVQVDAVRGLLSFLTEECCAGRPELCGEVFTSTKALCQQP
jgi:DNA-binding transcriptional ArsR family regulator